MPHDRTCRLLAGDDDRGARVAHFVAGLAREAGLTTSQSYWLRLAADEITMNIVEHGYRGQPGALDLSGAIEADRVWLRIEDDGPEFDPRSYDPRPLLAEPADTRAAGGYGLLLALTKVDEFHYRYRDGRNSNTVVLRRQVDDAAISPGGGQRGNSDSHHR